MGVSKTFTLTDYGGENGTRMCLKNDNGKWSCSRIRGHSGRHEAGVSETIGVHHWPNVTEVEEMQADWLEIWPGDKHSTIKRRFQTIESGVAWARNCCLLRGDERKHSKMLKFIDKWEPHVTADDFFAELGL